MALIKRRVSQFMRQTIRHCSSDEMEVMAAFGVDFHKTPGKITTTVTPPSMYGGRRMITMLPGSGVGPKLCKYVVEIFKFAQVPVDFEIIESTEDNFEMQLQEMLTSIRRNRVAVKGRLESGPTARTANVTICSQLDLFAYVVHYKTMENIKTRFPHLDLLLIRQNTEGEYAMLEHESVKGVVESMKIMTAKNVKRLAKFAFDLADKMRRKKITVVHKQQVMQISDGLFLEIVQEVSKNYPKITLDTLPVDRCVFRLVTAANSFDTLLMPNLYGSVISNTICGLAGGPGLYHGINYSDNYAIFEPATRHTGHDLVGKNKANPIAMLKAAISMLMYLEKYDHAKLINRAIKKTVKIDKVHTPDMGGTNSTTDMIERIKENILTDTIPIKSALF